MLLFRDADQKYKNMQLLVARYNEVINAIVYLASKAFHGTPRVFLLPLPCVTSDVQITKMNTIQFHITGSINFDHRICRITYTHETPPVTMEHFITEYWFLV